MTNGNDDLYDFYDNNYVSNIKESKKKTRGFVLNKIVEVFTRYYNHWPANICGLAFLRLLYISREFFYPYAIFYQ